MAGVQMKTAVVERNRKAAEARPSDPTHDTVNRFRDALHDNPVDAAPDRGKSPVRRVLKITAALAVLGLVGWQPVQRLLAYSSVEAVVNARLVTLRAPISGQVDGAVDLTPGAGVVAGQLILSIKNPRADRSRLDDLVRQQDAVIEANTVAAARLKSLSEEFQAAQAHLDRFVQSRRIQIDQRYAELEAERISAAATHEELKAQRGRTETLARRNASSRAQFDRAIRQEQVARQAVVAADRRIAALEVERDVLAAGRFFGDGYNDLPRTAERLSELRQGLAEQEAELQVHSLRLARLEAEIDRERERFALLSQAEIKSPTRGSVWETLTAPGEQVRQGQDLARLLDCEMPVVTAAVSEAVFNRLFVGASARFRLKDTAEELPGKVVQMAGLAATPSNYAISPAFIQREAYRVIVSVPGLVNPQRCLIGRTGRVTFDIPGTGLFPLSAS